ncbi:hypothetical protein EDC30_107147 [Paucimonas lemoignei]|uniref:Uncharacterized protein n=1 Tax=Paucimonas lemoignei TaxID=29443 RepID=A0A4V2UII7_PAULE|nr:DUF5985 family protein [Paucimonas lemoignei]TCS36330.1 hypothetical protein EDC30_107147 [Paucimonas lemoignei]
MQLNAVLAGAIIMVCLTVGLFFLRFWQSTRDKFFLYFAISFLLEAVNRIGLTMSIAQNEDMPMYYLIRLVSYALILFAILEKNKRHGKK